MKLSDKQKSIICLIIWLIFLIYTVLDNKNIFFPKGIDTLITLQTSIFARGMFIDLGILSFLMAIWMIVYTKNKFKFVFAFLTLFFGSFAVLPYLAIYFWNKEKDEG